MACECRDVDNMNRLGVWCVSVIVDYKECLGVVGGCELIFSLCLRC